MIGDARRRFPGHRRALPGTPEGHDSHLRFSWTLTDPEHGTVARGTAVATRDAQGGVLRVIGFLDGAPAA